MKLSSRKQLLSEADAELKRMQKLAGLLNESNSKSDSINEGLIGDLFKSIAYGSGQLFSKVAIPFIANMQLDRDVLLNMVDSMENQIDSMQGDSTGLAPEQVQLVHDELTNIISIIRKEVNSGKLKTINQVTDAFKQNIKPIVDKAKNKMKR